MTTAAFTEHRVPRGPGNVYARDYAGAAPAFVLMHGFPDNLRIYDDLVPHLVAAGRRVVTFDFLGFGASDKPADATYDFDKQLGDLEAVVDALGLGKVVLVPHDSSGLPGINFALDHPEKVAALCILNSAYDDTPLNVWPEMITLFADPRLRAFALAVAQDPAQFGWLLNWQKQKFDDALPEELKPHFRATVGQVVADNFIVAPSSGPAFVQMAAQFDEALKRNTARLPELAALDLPVKVIWGEYDPYLGLDLGRERASRFRHGSFQSVPGGHWLQSDQPEIVAKALLS